jgi:hypothetical protein
MSSTQEARVRSKRPIPWAAIWPAFLGLSVLLLAPATAHAGDDLGGRLDAQSVDFQMIDAYVTSQMQSMHIPGVALGIVHGDKIVHLQGFGVANPAGQLMTPQTPLILGSTSKSFTALAIMQLVEAVKISLDAGQTASKEESAAAARAFEHTNRSGAPTALGIRPAARPLDRLPVSGAGKLAAHLALLS